MKVIVIEDESEVLEILVSELEREGFQVRGLTNGVNALEHICEFDPDIVLLDQIMPIKNGSEVIVDIRSDNKVADIPIMMITALVGEADKIAALNLGADDYVTKPFSLSEVIARVHALVRRSQKTYRSPQKLLSYYDLKINLSAHKAMLVGEDLHLTLTEFRILCELIKKCGEVLSRDNLRELALGNLNVTDRTIDVHMASLRKKLGGLGELIETVRGVGYRAKQV